MKRISLITAVALATGALAAVPAASSAAVIVHATYDALWSVDVTYKHKLIYGKTSSAGEETAFRLTGSMPGLEFEDGYLMNFKSHQLDGAVHAGTKTWIDNPEGTSANCAGDTGQIKGLAVLGKEGAANGSQTIWFAPLAGIEVPLECTDSDDRDYAGKLSTGAISRAPGGPAGTWARKTVTLAETDVPQWEMPVDIRADADHCPEWDPEYSVSCKLSVQGKVTFFRTDRREELDLLSPDEVLSPTPPAPAPKPEDKPKPKAPKVDKPKLDRKGAKLRTGVSCEYDCEVGIGIFTHRKNGKPYVKPVKRRTVRVKGGGTTGTAQKLTVPLSKAQLGSIPKGKNATVKVTTTMAGMTATETFTVKG